MSALEKALRKAAQREAEAETWAKKQRADAQRKRSEEEDAGEGDGSDKGDGSGEEGEAEAEEDVIVFSSQSEESVKGARLSGKTLFCSYCQEDQPFDNFSSKNQKSWDDDRRFCLLHCGAGQSYSTFLKHPRDDSPPRVAEGTRVQLTSPETQRASGIHRWLLSAKPPAAALGSSGEDGEDADESEGGGEDVAAADEGKVAAPKRAARATQRVLADASDSSPARTARMRPSRRTVDSDDALEELAPTRRRRLRRVDSSDDALDD